MPGYSSLAAVNDAEQLICCSCRLDGARDPEKRKTARVCGGNSEMAMSGSFGSGRVSRLFLLGMKNLTRQRPEAASVCETGGVIAISSDAA